MVEHPRNPNSNNVETSIVVKPNIVVVFVDVKPIDVDVSVDLKLNVDSKENIVKHYVNKLADNEVDTMNYFFTNVKYKFRDDLINWGRH